MNRAIKTIICMCAKTVVLGKDLSFCSLYSDLSGKTLRSVPHMPAPKERGVSRTRFSAKKCTMKTIRCLYSSHFNDSLFMFLASGCQKDINGKFFKRISFFDCKYTNISINFIREKASQQRVQGRLTHSSTPQYAVSERSVIRQPQS